MQSIQVPQNVEFTFASTPTMIAHFPLNGNGTDTRGDLQLIRGPGDADPQSLQFQSGAPEVTISSEHLFIPDQPNQFVSVRRQDDEEFVTFDESLSVSFWFRPESGGTVLSIRQARASAADQLQIVQLEYVPDNTINNPDDGPITFVVGAERHVVPSTFSPLEDGWFHAAFVINPFLSGEEAVALFINGRRVPTSGLPQSLQVNADELLRLLDIRLGADHDAGDRFRGGISDLRFESIYLTGVQVAQQLLPEGAELPSHPVVFDSNGATAGTPPLSRVYLQGSDIDIPGEGDLSKMGAFFLGWSTVPEAGAADPIYQESDSLQVLGPITYYAQWQLPTLNVSVEVNDIAVPPIEIADTSETGFSIVPGDHVELRYNGPFPVVQWRLNGVPISGSADARTIVIETDDVEFTRGSVHVVTLVVMDSQGLIQSENTFFVIQDLGGES